MNPFQNGAKALLLLAGCVFTLTAGAECNTFNPQTQLDGGHRRDDRTSPLVDIHRLDAPNLVQVADVGDTFTIEVRAEDAEGDPLPDTEARINALFDPTKLELVIACGGNDGDFNDDPITGCQGLVPAYHLFDNDGVMWFRFRALDEGETDVTFVYPGAVERQFERDGADRELPPGAPRPAGDDWTDEDVTHVVIGGAAADSDEDGVPDFEDVCPATPEGANVDEDGCPIPDGEEHPALADLAPLDLVFHGTNTSLACGFTNVSPVADAASSNVGGPNPLRIVTHFPPPFEHGDATTTVQGPYDAATGDYTAEGTSGIGAEHELDGVWTVDENGDPRFDGTLTERFLSPTCENTFIVSYTVD